MSQFELPQNRRILVIDDNRAIHEDFKKILAPGSPVSVELENLERDFFGDPASAGPKTVFQIDSALQGQEGLESVRQALREGRPYALAFVDMRMPPGWDGIETIARIWQEDSEMQVVICTAFSDYSWDEMLKKLGQTDRLVILKKPFDTIEVCQLARTLTEKWQLSQQVRQKLDDLENVVRKRTVELTAANQVLLAEISQRKQIEENLRLKTTVLEAADNGIVITNSKGCILWVNPAFSKLTGYSASEATGKTPAMLKSGAHDPAFYQAMWETILAGKVWQGEIVNRRKDGSLYTEEMTITPVFDDHGAIRNFVAIKQDISQRKQFEQALARERDLLQALMDNLPDYIYFKDTRSRFIRINKAQASLLGLKEPQEAMGRADTEFLFSRLARQALVDEGRIIATGEPMLDVQEQIHTAAGKTIWVSSTKVPFRDRDGAIAGIAVVARDITERKRAEVALAEASSLLQTLLDNTPDCIYFKDVQSRFVHFSKSFQHLFKVADAECLRGKTDFDFFLEEHARPAYEDEQKIIRTGQPLIGKLEKENHPDGRITWAMTTKMPWRDQDGKIIGTFGISKDVTALKDAEREQHVMEAQLRQAQKLEAVGQLAAGIAHEINTPTQYVGDNTRFLKDSFDTLTQVLRSHAELLAAAKSNALTPELITRAEKVVAASDLDYLQEQIPAAIQQTLDGVDRVAKIVRAMKDFSHPGTNEKVQVDLNRSIESTLTVCRNEWKYVADMVTEYDPHLPPVACLPGEINQMILNIVVNAAHAVGDAVGDGNKAKGVITVSTRRDGDWVEIRIRDTGTGIPEHARSRVFNPFFTTKGVGKGTGQGLTIAHSVIVDKHGGNIRFETEMGRGTTFIIRLPLAPPAAVVERQAA